MSTTVIEQPQRDITGHARLAGIEEEGGRLWHSSAPGALAGGNGSKNGKQETSDRWTVWRRHLASRTNPGDLATLLESKTWPLAWALPDELNGSATRQWINRLAPSGKKPSRKQPPAIPAERIAAWLAEADDAPASVALGLESLAIAHALPRLSGVLDAELWWAAADLLIRRATEPPEAGRDDDRRRDDPLAWQLLVGELPYALAWQFPELKPCRKLWPVGRDVLSQGLVDLLDGEGLPHAAHLHLLRPLLACWTRALAMAEAGEQKAFSKQAHLQYQWLVRMAMLLTRKDGGNAFTTGTAGAWNADLFAAALDLGGDCDDELAAQLVLPGGKAKKRINEAILPGASVESEWASVAILRSGWSRKADKLFVKFARDRFEIELDAAGGCLLSGSWSLDVRGGGTPLPQIDHWESVCWEQDDDAVYFEAEAKLAGGARVQRHLLLVKEDDLVFLADSVLGVEEGPIDYRSRFALAPGVNFTPAHETRDGALCGRKHLANALPLALPEWRTDPRYGELVGDEHHMELRQRNAGPNLCCPLVLDLRARRLVKELTWRQLTVAENREIVPPHVAAGYRVQCGKNQWLFYRSLAAAGNRTLLAQNLVTEFYAARIDRAGDAETLILVE